MLSLTSAFSMFISLCSGPLRHSFCFTMSLCTIILQRKTFIFTQACCCCFSLYTTLSLRVHFWDGFHCSFQHYKHSQQKIDLLFLEKYENSNFHSFDEHIHDFFPLFAKNWRDFPSVVLLISFQALAFLLPNLCSI